MSLQNVTARAPLVSGARLLLPQNVAIHYTGRDEANIKRKESEQRRVGDKRERKRQKSAHSLV